MTGREKMNKRIIFRLPDEMYERLTMAMNEGRFKSLSELVRKALDEFLSKGE
jgi:Arc/MetJ-type ribon-helix-helix transcriptional regulator